jgi:hypothetical protein
MAFLFRAAATATAETVVKYHTNGGGVEAKSLTFFSCLLSIDLSKLSRVRMAKIGKRFMLVQSLSGD